MGATLLIVKIVKRSVYVRRFDSSARLYLCSKLVNCTEWAFKSQPNPSPVFSAASNATSHNQTVPTLIILKTRSCTFYSNYALELTFTASITIGAKYLATFWNFAESLRLKMKQIWMHKFIAKLSRWIKIVEWSKIAFLKYLYTGFVNKSSSFSLPNWQNSSNMEQISNFSASLFLKSLCTTSVSL